MVLTGPNGAGKTNLLEAVSFLAPGRGLRGAKLTEIDRRRGGRQGDEPRRGWAVAAGRSPPKSPPAAARCAIGTGRDGGDGGERRVVRIDGEPARSQAALGERLGIVWLTPPMDRLFVDGPAAGGGFSIGWCSALDPAHAARVARL